ncbi:MAG TPA: patatin-like phospholipase family protein [Ktedonobacteraceae bacterium]|nr:patatin-like phospholipase family protein [Ktedonobacteraceae bacterium]
MKNRRRALVLQGGGALGAYAYGVIKALYEQPDFCLDVVTGVSIGALNAAVLVGARDDPIRALDELWRKRLSICNWPFMPSMLDRYSSLLGNPAMYWIRPSYVYAPLLAPFFETSIYDTTALRQTLAALIDLDRMNHSEIHLVMSAVDIETGEVAYFENQNTVPLSFEHIVASGSLAPGFPMTSIKDPRTGEKRWYWDGGFSSNLPLAKAIDLLEQIDSYNPDVERELIVIELFPMQAALPANLVEVQDRITQLLFSSKMILDERLFQRMNDYVELIEQIDQALPADSALRQLPGYKDLKRHRKIDSFLVFTMNTPEFHSGASDFSQAAIERRIAAGYRDALTQLEKFGRRERN